MPHATLPSPGLQALILCGPGLSLNTFTSNPSDLPKALLPIANRPMVWYPLDWCHRMGITDITLITPPEAKAALESALRTHPALTGLPSPRPEVLAPEGLEMTTGTGEVFGLEEVGRCVRGDFVVVPCDLVSEVEGTRLLQQWMTLNPSSQKGWRSKAGLAVYYPTYGLEGISNKKDETDFVATVPLPNPTVPPPHGSLRPHIEEIVLALPTDTLNDTLEEHKGILPIRQRLLTKHGRVKMRTKHRDAHIYIFPHWVADFAAKNERFDSISEDVLGWWAKAGWQEGLAEKLGLDEILADERSNDDEGDAGQDDEEIDVSALSSTKAAPRVQELGSTSFASRVGTLESKVTKPLTIPPLLAYIQPPSSTSASSPQPLIRRVDTAPQLASISLYLARQPPATAEKGSSNSLAHEHKIHPTARIGQQTRISQEDCLIAENVTIGTRCAIKESVVGANCDIGNNVRLTKCVLMDGVTIGDGVQLTGCVIGRRARIEGMRAVEQTSGSAVEGSVQQGDAKGKRKKGSGGGGGGGEEEGRTKLTECEVAPYFVVEAGTEAKGETLKGFDTGEGALVEEDEQGKDAEDDSED